MKKLILVVLAGAEGEKCLVYGSTASTASRFGGATR